MSLEGVVASPYWQSAPSLRPVRSTPPTFAEFFHSRVARHPESNCLKIHSYPVTIYGFWGLKPSVESGAEAARKERQKRDKDESEFSAQNGPVSWVQEPSSNRLQSLELGGPRLFMANSSATLRKKRLPVSFYFIMTYTDIIQPNTMLNPADIAVCFIYLVK